jgi:hypothetical protein
MFGKLFGSFKNIGDKLKYGWNIGKRIYNNVKGILPVAIDTIKETIETYKGIDDPIEKEAFKDQIGDVIGKIPSNILLNPITEFFVKKKEDNFDDWED